MNRTLHPRALPLRHTPGPSGFVPPRAAPTARRERELGLALLFGVAVTLAAAAAFVATRRPGPTIAPPPAYETAPVAQGALTGTLQLEGRLAPAAIVEVDARGGAERRVASVHVELGQRVARGQLLARLEDVDERVQVVATGAELTAAQASAQYAALQLAEIMSLLQLEQLAPGQGLGGDGVDDGPAEGEGDGTQEIPIGPELLTDIQRAALAAEVRAISAAAEVATKEAAFVRARAALSRTAIRAPRRGIVVARAAEPGASAGDAGRPLFVIATEPRRLRLAASVGERDLEVARSGPVEIVVPALPGRRFSGTIRSVALLPAARTSPSGGAARYDLLVDVDNADGLLRAGMTAALELPRTTATDSLHVPREAVGARLDEAGGRVGAVVEVLGPRGARARVPVEVGASDGARVEIRSAALRAGDRVLVGAR